MSKLPTKQIYLLLIIIVGIIALSIYSTYAIFTLDSETSDIVSIHTPNSLSVSESIYEYQQVTAKQNTYSTTDVDIYNTNESEICYSIWYKLPANISKNSIKIYQNTSENIQTTGTISSMNKKRISLLIINYNTEDIDIKVGVATSVNNGTCELNIASDKTQVNSTINNPKTLVDTISKEENKTNEAGYLVYKDLTEEVVLNETIYVSEAFTYQDEIFTLKDPKEISKENIKEYISKDDKKYYTCLEETKCKNLYQINSYKKETNENYTDIYKLDKYNLLVGYLKGESGIKKVSTNNNYYYYGDNPNNFIYFNCSNQLDKSTCELWRIIGTYYNNETNEYLTKIISNNNISNIEYNSNSDNLFKNSKIINYLNKEYESNNDYLLEEVSYQQEYLTSLQDSSYSYQLDKIKSKFSIISLSDYLNTSLCTNYSEYNQECLENNWLNNGQEQWTMTINIENSETEDTLDLNQVYTVSSDINLKNTTELLNIRPVAYIKNKVLILSGDGTIENPYVIN